MCARARYPLGSSRAAVLQNNLGMSRNDLRKADLPSPDWSDPAAALAAIHSYAIAQAKDAENWYADKRRAKKRGGRALRLLAIALGGIAAILPLIGEIFADDGKPAVSPAWASVALLLAGLLIAADRYLDLSLGWTRFMEAELAITQLRHTFEFRWQEAEVENLDPRQRLAIAEELIEAIDEVVGAETKTWSADARSSLDSAVAASSPDRGQ